MLSPLPRRSDWWSCLAHPSSHISLPRYGRQVGLRIVLFEAYSVFTRVTACTLALSPIRDTLIEGFSHFVTSMTAPIASGWSGCRVGLAPTGKRRLVTAHVESRCDAVALGSNISVSAPFVRRCLTGSTITPFSHPAHRTGQADFPHPALGQNFTPSPTARRAQAGSSVRAQSARKDARVNRSRPCGAWSCA